MTTEPKDKTVTPEKYYMILEQFMTSAVFIAGEKAYTQEECDEARDVIKNLLLREAGLKPGVV